MTFLFFPPFLQTKNLNPSHVSDGVSSMFWLLQTREVEMNDNLGIECISFTMTLGKHIHRISSQVQFEVDAM